MLDFQTISKTSEIPEGQTRPFTVGDKNIAISCVQGKYYAFINTCSHMDFSLDTGVLEGTSIECAHHGAKFDVVTGKAICMPAVSPIETYPVKVEGDEIKVQV
jgi:3-phenylpropionate/trans-cinnamate dioxygenase ferredoxin component